MKICQLRPPFLRSDRRSRSLLATTLIVDASTLRGWIYSTPRFKKGVRRHSIPERPTRSLPFISWDRKGHSCRKGDLFDDTRFLSSRGCIKVSTASRCTIVIRLYGCLRERVDWTERRNEMSHLRRYWTTRQRTYGILGSKSVEPSYGVVARNRVTRFSLSPLSLFLVHSRNSSNCWFRFVWVKNCPPEKKGDERLGQDCFFSFFFLLSLSRSASPFLSTVVR